MFANAQRSARGVFGGAVVAGFVVLAGCGKESTGSNLPNGAVTVALATTGSDGATYQFPPGSFLETFNTTGFTAFFPIDGSEAVLTETVPAGGYTTLLFFSNNGPVQLVRTLNGMSQTVSATWTDPQPFNFNILQNMTTPIVLHFSVVNLGDVTFQVGRVQVSIDVNPTTSTMANNAQESGTVTETFQQIAPGFGLEAPLGLTAGEIDAESLSMALTGPFALQSPGFACATATLTASSAPASSAAFVALMEEFTGTPPTGAVVCVFDSGATDTVEVEVFRNGPAPADQQTFLPGGNYQFLGIVEFLAGDIFDGTTLKLSQLASPIALSSTNSAFWEHQIFDFDTSQNLEISAGNISGGTFQLTP
jgi:hypothetical protein